MRGPLNKIKNFLVCFFSFSRPAFVRLRYEHIVISKKSYLLITWAYKNAYQLKIRELRYRSYRRSSSAYMVVPAGAKRLTIKLSNCWRSRTFKLPVIESNLETVVDYFPIRSFPEIQLAGTYRPRLTTRLKAPAVDPRIRIVAFRSLKFTLKNPF